MDHQLMPAPRRRYSCLTTVGFTTDVALVVYAVRLAHRQESLDHSRRSLNLNPLHVVLCCVCLPPLAFRHNKRAHQHDCGRDSATPPELS